MSVPDEIRTARIQLRQWTARDEPHLLAIQSLVEVVKWQDDGPPKVMKDIDEARERIASYERQARPHGVWAVVPDDVGHPVGSVMLNPVPESGEPALTQIGWSLHPTAWGHGYAAEAASALLDAGLAAGVSEIYALTNLTNFPSIAVALRIGMTDLGTTDDYYEEPSRIFVARSPAT
jgi:RimJ/RimL family protein N-acetyltransferase